MKDEGVVQAGSTVVQLHLILLSSFYYDIVLCSVICFPQASTHRVDDRVGTWVDALGKVEAVEPQHDGALAGNVLPDQPPPPSDRVLTRAKAGEAKRVRGTLCGPKRMRQTFLVVFQVVRSVRRTRFGTNKSMFGPAFKWVRDRPDLGERKPRGLDKKKKRITGPGATSTPRPRTT